MVPSSQGSLLTPGREPYMAAPAALEDVGALGRPTGSVQTRVRRKDPSMTGTPPRGQEVQDTCTHPDPLPHVLPALAIPSPEDGGARTSSRVPAHTYPALPPCRHGGQPLALSSQCGGGWGASETEQGG